MTTIAVLKETVKGENRVSLVPESVKRLVKHGLRVLIQDGSGSSAGFRQNAYEEVGATIISQYDDIVNEGDIFLKVNCICLHDGMMDIIDPFPTSSVIILITSSGKTRASPTFLVISSKRSLFGNSFQNLQNRTKEHCFHSNRV